MPANDSAKSDIRPRRCSPGRASSLIRWKNARRDFLLAVADLHAALIFGGEAPNSAEPASSSPTMRRRHASIQIYGAQKLEQTPCALVLSFLENHIDETDPEI